MSVLSGKQIVLGVSGGIAAYKSADLVRRLSERGAEVRVVMTSGAQEFVTPLTFQAVSGYPVSTTLLDPAAEAAMGHIELARWADLVLIAPASANTLSRLAQGSANDLLGTLCLATEAPIFVAPAMNRVMWANPAVQRNTRQLVNDGVSVIGPAQGEQACGEVGKGRMSEPLEIVAHLELVFEVKPNSLNGKKVVITAGPTREAIDPVRYISNHSSGKMGYAVAEAAKRLGADVVLVSGPVSLSTPNNVVRIDVESAQEMLDAVQAQLSSCDIFISVAAVADYRAVEVADNKIKKSKDRMQIEMIKNPDVLGTIASSDPKPFCVGFAAETDNVAQYALAKLQRKNLDMIAANDVSVEEGVFNADENALDVFWPDSGHEHISRRKKTALADALLALVSEQFQLKNKK